ncbi:DUF6879 family protein [Micromonospora sp. NPDC048935]|uniref:DUF6879 family protein n=1 Tax=Micromonospora sp. NPDC048935 TaxID=3364262 RepID=UPI00371AF808
MPLSATASPSSGERALTRSFTSLDDDEFNQLFRDFRYTAYRLETLQRYDVSYEQDEFARFLAGQTRGEFPGSQHGARPCGPRCRWASACTGSMSSPSRYPIMCGSSVDGLTSTR